MTYPSKDSIAQDSDTHMIHLGCGSLWITRCFEDDKLDHILISGGKGGECRALIGRTVGQLITTLLRCGIEPSVISAMLAGSCCPEGTWHDGKHYESCMDYLSSLLTDRR